MIRQKDQNHRRVMSVLRPDGNLRKIEFNEKTVDIRKLHDGLVKAGCCHEIIPDRAKRGNHVIVVKDGFIKGDRHVHKDTGEERPSLVIDVLHPAGHVKQFEIDERRGDRKKLHDALVADGFLHHKIPDRAKRGNHIIVLDDGFIQRDKYVHRDTGEMRELVPEGSTFGPETGTSRLIREGKALHKSMPKFGRNPEWDSDTTVEKGGKLLTGAAKAKALRDAGE